MKRITLGNLPGLNLKELGGMYLTIFGAIWLVLEPLGFFGVFPNAFSNLGLIGYALLLIVSFLIFVPISQVWRKVKLYRQELVTVVVVSSLEGITYEVKVPANLQVWDFVSLFIEYLEKGTQTDKVKAIRRLYSPVLNLRRNGESRAIDNSMSISEIGIEKDDVFFISGKPIEDNTIRFSISR